MADTPWGIEAQLAYGKCFVTRLMAEGDPTYNKVCIFCKKKVFYVPDFMARMRGHLYSEDGMREFNITRICEFCFDETADRADGVVVDLEKLWPHDSMAQWKGSH